MPERGTTPPIVVVEGGADSFAAAQRDVRGVWGVAHAVAVTTQEDAAAAVLRAVAGEAVVVHLRASAAVADQLLEDLRRLGPVDVRQDREGRGALTPEEQELVSLLAEGTSIGEAARRLHISRRTADRRLAQVRRAAGASTTAEAVAALARGGPRS